MTQSVSPIVPQRFRAVFEEASRSTGASFDYLLRTAQRESSLNPSAKAPSSSATGLFQFVEQTWLETMKQAGPELGFGKAAAQITQVGDKFHVRDPQARQDILAMREDPRAAALLAGAYARKNEAMLENRLERTPSPGELYVAHFLGANGSGRLIELAKSHPGLDAAKTFPEQAQANRNIFYDTSGKSRSVGEVYDNLVGTVPGREAEKKNPLSRIFNLGEWFKPKASMSESRFASAESPAVEQQAQLKAKLAEQLQAKQAASSHDVAQFFAEPGQAAQDVPASRYGLAYSGETDPATAGRRSRIALGEDGEQLANAAAGAGRKSRIFTSVVKQPDVTGTVPHGGASAGQGHSEASSMPLPRRKPVTADVYVNSLGSIPGGSFTIKPAPVDLVGDEASVGNADKDKPGKKFGALDLTAFLDGDVFSKIKNG